MLQRISHALAVDDGATPITLLRRMRDLEAQAEQDRTHAEAIERELAQFRAPTTVDTAEDWVALIEGVETLDVDMRMRAREIIRDSLSRIVIWHRGDPFGTEDGEVIDLEVTARGGGTARIRVDRSTGALVERYASGNAITCAMP